MGLSGRWYSNIIDCGPTHHVCLELLCAENRGSISINFTHQYELRISTLECSVNTPTVINFGTVGRNLTANTELSKQTNSFNVTCVQTSGYISANVAVQFRPLTSLYGGAKNRLALAQGGGYITGEITGITDSGT